MINYKFSSPGSFGSRFRQTYIDPNTYKGKRRNFHLKLTHIHGPVNKSELIISYSRIHFSWLSLAVYKRLISRLSQKVSYYFMNIDPIVDGFGPNELSIH